MDAKFQAKRMQVISQRLEALVRHRGGKALRSWSIPAVGVHRILRELGVALWSGICHEPFHINHNVLPSEGFEMFREPFGVRFDLVFVNCGSVSVPTVPAQRWCSNHCGSTVPRSLTCTM